MTRMAVHHRYTFEQYLTLEESSNVRHEYFQGEIYAMAGGTPDHAALAMNFGAALVTLLRDRPCRVFSSDLRIRVRDTGLATHPDVTVVCGPLERDPESATTVTNSLLIAEVLSDSTGDYDRGEKFEHYKRLPSLREYVLISHRRAQVEVWRRAGGDEWTREEIAAGGVVHLETCGGGVAVDEIYRGGLEDAKNI